MQFLEWKLLYFNENFIGICSPRRNWQYSSIGLDNGLAPVRGQAIVWISNVLDKWCIYGSLSLNELTHCGLVMPYDDIDLGQRGLNPYLFNSRSQMTMMVRWLVSTYKTHSGDPHLAAHEATHVNTHSIEERWLSSDLILLVLKPEYSGQTRSIPWLLMPWLLASPGHHHPWYWLCRINGPCPPWGRISTTCVTSVLRNDRKCDFILCFIR